MAEPGASVREDKDYKKEAADKRKYWETGENDSLTDDQKKKHCELAEQAAKYDRKTKKSGDDYPRSKDKKIDHGALVRNAKEWVYDALQPHRDIKGKQNGHLKLGEIVDGSGTPEKPIDPSGGDTTKPAWVCINCAKLLAGFLRCLDYPVREVSTWL